MSYLKPKPDPLSNKLKANIMSQHNSVGGRSLDLGNAFILSAGTVTIDSNSNKILLLFYRRKSEYMLPKGRKNQGESLAEAAVRETFEESGYHCALIRHDAPTQAHPASTQAATEPLTAHMEPIACQQRFAHGVRKIVFWYLAVGDATEVKTEGTQEEGEDFDSMWVDVELGLSMLAYEDDRQIAELAATVVSVLG